mgnify:CR=1 FL=1
MSQIEDFSILAYLHDAQVHRLVYYYVGADSRRCLELLVCGHKDCGYKLWAKKNVVLTFFDCLMVGGCLCGHMLGADSIDSFRTNYLLPEVEAKVAIGVMAGLRESPVKISVAFSSGTELSIACELVTVFVADRQDEDQECRSL